MIKSFKCKDTARLFNDQRVGRFHAIEHASRKKLLYLHAANNLEALKFFPGNRLEPLKGNRAGQYSLRINQQWRLCFRWESGNATDVEIIDYH